MNVYIYIPIPAWSPTKQLLGFINWYVYVHSKYIHTHTYTHTHTYGLPWWLKSVKRLPVIREIWVQSLGWEDPLEEDMATHSSILAWRNPQTEEPGGLQSMELQSHNWVTSHTYIYIYRASLVARWWRIPLPMQRTDSIPGPGRSQVPQGNWAHGPQLLKPARPRVCAPQETPRQWACAPQGSSSHSPQLEKAKGQQQGPSTAKN